MFLKKVYKNIGKVIKDIQLTDKTLTFVFDDGTEMSISDTRKCCEKRYMHTNDYIPHFIGAEFFDARVQNGPTTKGTERNREVRQSQFLIITTSIGEFTIVNYNEHNGWYSGFDLSVK